MIPARLAAPILAGIVCAGLGALAADRLPIVGAQAVIARIKADRDAWKATAADWKANAAAWRATAEGHKGARIQETAQARAALAEATSACNARVAAARRSATAIADLLAAHPPESAHAAPNACPDRSLLPADRLRDALRPR